MISFDWALKRLLRSKANYEVLEGFLSELIRRKIIIKHIIESESNKDDARNKSNRVDILVEADDREIIIIELQYDSEKDYFQRMLYGASKTIAEYINEGDRYSEVRKVYSINIVYFDLGRGDDYVYHGSVRFTGLHDANDELQLSAKQQKLYGKTVPGEFYPEYYIIKVRKFDDIAQDTLDQWIYYLKNNKIKDDFTAQGLAKAREVLAFDNLTDEEKRAYNRHIEDERIRNSEMETAYEDGLDKGEAIGRAKGRAEGEAKGRAEGRAEGRTEVQENVVLNGHRAGCPIEVISTMTGLTSEQITEILKRHGLI
jgi:predicted transposase/invertase (TIGR01784 family)